MTLRKAKSIARHFRLTLRQVRSGDYRVNFRDGNETTACYTDSLEDAINTAVGESCTIQSWRRDLASPELRVIAEPAKAEPRLHSSCNGHGAVECANGLTAH